MGIHMHISLWNCSLLTMMHSRKQKLNGLKILYIYTACAMIQHQKKVPSGIVMLSKQDVNFLLTTIHWPMPSLYCPLGQWSLSISPHKEFLWCKLMKSWYCQMFLSSFFANSTHKNLLGGNVMSSYCWAFCTQLEAQLKDYIGVLTAWSPWDKLCT